MNRQKQRFINLFLVQLLFLVLSTANANGVFLNNTKLNGQTLHFKGKNSQTGNNIYQLIIDKVIISNSKQHCTITDSNNNNGSINLESVYFQPFSWKGNYGDVTGSLITYGGSYVKWDQLQS